MESSENARQTCQARSGHRCGHSRAGVVRWAQSVPKTIPDETAIRQILDSEVTTWNKGDTDGYSRDFATDGTFTNIRGMFFTGHQEFRDRHEAIFKGEFRGTSLKQEIVSLRFIRPDVAIAETLTWVSGFPKAGPPPGTQVDANGRLRCSSVAGPEKRRRRMENRGLSQCGCKAGRACARAAVTPFRPDPAIGTSSAAGASYRSPLRVTDKASWGADVEPRATARPQR